MAVQSIRCEISGVGHEPQGHVVKQQPDEQTVPPPLAPESAQAVLNTDGAARYLGISRALLEFYRVRGGGPRYAKFGRLVRYRRAALDEWLKERERSSTSEPRSAS